MEIDYNNQKKSKTIYLINLTLIKARELAQNRHINCRGDLRQVCCNVGINCLNNASSGSYIHLRA